MSGYFITGAGTGVGKTFVTCALLHASKGTARAYKPIITGWDESDQTDTAKLIAGTREVLTVEEVSPWRYAAPIAPHRAAALEGRTVPYDALTVWSRARFSQKGLTFMEGVGGLMVPIDSKHTVLHWMRALGMPAIVVAGSYLGSINHTLMTIALLQHAKIHIAALVVNETPDSDISLMEMHQGLGLFVESVALRVFQPRVQSPSEAVAIHSLLEKLA